MNEKDKITMRFLNEEEKSKIVNGLQSLIEYRLDEISIAINNEEKSMERYTFPYFKNINISRKISFFPAELIHKFEEEYFKILSEASELPKQEEFK